MLTIYIKIKMFNFTFLVKCISYTFTILKYVMFTVYTTKLLSSFYFSPCVKHKKKVNVNFMNIKIKNPMYITK